MRLDAGCLVVGGGGEFARRQCRRDADSAASASGFKNSGRTAAVPACDWRELLNQNWYFNQSIIYSVLDW
jgi:hypothetical protein